MLHCLQSMTINLSPKTAVLRFSYLFSNLSTLLLPTSPKILANEKTVVTYCKPLSRSFTMEKDSNQKPCDVDQPDGVIKSNRHETSSIIIDKVPYTSVTEGQAEILFPSSHDVFYNPVQEFNRDISIAVMKEYIKSGWSHKRLEENSVKVVEKQLKREKFDNDSKITILEALSASGLRSVRYAKELGVDNISIVANDVSRQAVESIKRNVAHNHVDHVVSWSQADAALLMYQHRKFGEQFQIVDIDPYGTPSPFLDSAVQAVKDGGLLMVTCTDMAVLCGNSSETCYSKYGAVSLKTKCCHEMALRITLQCIESHCNRYGRYMIPFLSLSVDFYIRIFVQVWTSPQIVKRSFSKMSMVYQCSLCETFHLQPLGRCNQKSNGQYSYSVASGPPVSKNCVNCGSVNKIGGPIWTSAMHNKTFVADLTKSIESEGEKFKTSRRMLGMLNLVHEEIDDVPLHYNLDRLCAVAHVPMPPLVKFRSALLNAGYRVSMTHTAKNSIKTDAPNTFLWDIVRELYNSHETLKQLEEKSPASKILKQPLTHEISFKEHADANPKSRQNHMLRFQLNPEKHWGPKMRSQTSLWSDKPIEKGLRKQGKRNKQSNESEDLKSRSCKRFKKGQCQLGDDCKYSHETFKE